MAERLNFLVQIVLISGLVSVAVKYGGRWLPLPAENWVALGLVVLPVVLFGLALGQRARN